MLSSIVLAAVAVAMPVAPVTDQACLTGASPESLARRASPLDSTSFTIGKAMIKICYGRPSARGRTMLGGTAAPFGQLWRTGANEPTLFITDTPMTVGGVHVPAGTYSFYTVPGEKEWVVILNRSTSQWGEEGRYTDAVKAQEVGRGKAPAAAIDAHVEQFTIRGEASGATQGRLVLEWEKTRVVVPIVLH